MGLLPIGSSILAMLLVLIPIAAGRQTVCYRFRQSRDQTALAMRHRLPTMIWSWEDLLTGQPAARIILIIATVVLVVMGTIHPNQSGAMMLTLVPD